MKHTIMIAGTALLMLTGFTAKSQTVVGNDADKHGCKPSTGYTYSTLKKECIQPFTQEVQLTEVAPKGSSTSMGAVIFDAAKKKAEIFIPGLGASSLVLSRKGKTDIWAKGEYELAKTAAGYVLKKAGTEIFKTKA